MLQPYATNRLLVFGYLYAYSLRRLRKPIFWSQLVIIVLLSAVFWKSSDSTNFGLSWQGLAIGIEMMLRALFIVVAFSGLSVELRNEKVREFLFKFGFGRFYKSMALAFGALPIMIAMLPTSGEIIKAPFKSMIKPLVMADKWLKEFESTN